VLKNVKFQARITTIDPKRPHLYSITFLRITKEFQNVWHVYSCGGLRNPSPTLICIRFCFGSNSIRPKDGLISTKIM
jgi:hypothetical protein